MPASENIWLFNYPWLTPQQKGPLTAAHSISRKPVIINQTSSRETLANQLIITSANLTIAFLCHHNREAYGECYHHAYYYPQPGDNFLISMIGFLHTAQLVDVVQYILHARECCLALD